MAEKKSVPPPIDRPLSKAYLRQFVGWQTQYPPGLSEPNSLRYMENMQVDRNGGLLVRPGLRYASYIAPPVGVMIDDGKEIHGYALTELWQPATSVSPTGLSIAGQRAQMVGSFEPFYIEGGIQASLFAMRMEDGTVGFKVMRFDKPDQMIYDLWHPEIGFKVPNPPSLLNFSSKTKFVSYLQIDNKIIAMSDTAEPVRLFFVGGEKNAKVVSPVIFPEWDDTHKLEVIHPDNDWILKNPYKVRRNELLNPSFAVGKDHWALGGHGGWGIQESDSAPGGRKYAVVYSLPQRKNLIKQPLHNVKKYGITGWHSGYGSPKLQDKEPWLRIYDEKGKGLFLADSNRFSGIEEGKKYRLAFDYNLSERTDVKARLRWYRNNGAQIGDTIKMDPDDKKGRFVSRAIEAPKHAVYAMVRIGANSETKAASWVKVKDVMFCLADESTNIFTGDSGAGHFWNGTENKASSQYWPTTSLTLTSDRVPVTPSDPITGSIYVRNNANAVVLTCTQYDKDGKEVASKKVTQQATSAWTRMSVVVDSAAKTSVSADLKIDIIDLTPLRFVHFDAGMIESSQNQVLPFFTGSFGPKGPSAGKLSTTYSWEKPRKPHRSPSIETTKVDPQVFISIPGKETPSAKTLISTGGPDTDKYKIGMFYTFETEFGETAPSKVTEVRTLRGRNSWLWVQPSSGSGDPDYSKPTTVADLCCDQLVAKIPQAVYDKAVQEGAIRWNLYVLEWNEQEPVPVEAARVDSKEIYPDITARATNTPLPYVVGGWLAVTPNRKVTLDSLPLPSKEERDNYSGAPQVRAGLVAGDRMILVGNREDPARIIWSSARAGWYTNFTPNKGGGRKTLSSGNLHVPGAVVLWQNPQSVDTITILTVGSDGTSTCHYMTPAEVSAQTSLTGVMGFEEVTNTPGATSPYGSLIFNNAMYHPLDRGLMKSTAQNYNINHKLVTDDIRNMWVDLIDKDWIVAEEYDGRLYFLVNNPRGEPIEDGCIGNEIWVLDSAVGDGGAWSRFLVQGAALRLLEYGPRVYIGVARPEGMFYLDPEAREDDYVVGGRVYQRPIPWYFETNTQGANRAHDAWAHLQQVSVRFGNFFGAADYGIRTKTIDGVTQVFKKRFEEFTPLVDDNIGWDVEDHLLIRRNVKEWFFFAGSVEGKHGSGQLNYVQYRYSPVTVNVGYEYGSVETFEYGRNVLRGEDAYSQVGVPRPELSWDWQRNT